MNVLEIIIIRLDLCGFYWFIVAVLWVEIGVNAVNYYPFIILFFDSDSL